MRLGMLVGLVGMWMEMGILCSGASPPPPPTCRKEQREGGEERNTCSFPAPRSIQSEILTKTQEQRKEKEEGEKKEDRFCDTRAIPGIPVHCAKQCGTQKHPNDRHGICSQDQIDKALNDPESYHFLEMGARGALPWACNLTGGRFDKVWRMERVKQPGRYGALAQAILGLLYQPVKLAVDKNVELVGENNAVIPYCIVRSPGQMAHFAVLFKAVENNFLTNSRASEQNKESDYANVHVNWERLASPKFMDEIRNRLTWNDPPSGGRLSLSEYPVFLPLNCFRGFLTGDIKHVCSIPKAYLRDNCTRKDAHSCSLFPTPHFYFQVNVSVSQIGDIQVDQDKYPLVLKRLMDRPLSFIGLLVTKSEAEIRSEVDKPTHTLTISAKPDTKLVRYEEWEGKRRELACLLDRTKCDEDVFVYTFEDIQGISVTPVTVPEILYPVSLLERLESSSTGVVPELASWRPPKSAVCEGDFMSVQTGCDGPFQCRERVPSNCSYPRQRGLASFSVTFNISGTLCGYDLDTLNVSQLVMGYSIIEVVEEALINLTVGNEMRGTGSVLHVVCIKRNTSNQDEVNRVTVNFVVASSAVRWANMWNTIHQYLTTIQPSTPPHTYNIVPDVVVHHEDYMHIRERKVTRIPCTYSNRVGRLSATAFLFPLLISNFFLPVLIIPTPFPLNYALY